MQRQRVWCVVAPLYVALVEALSSCHCSKKNLEVSAGTTWPKYDHVLGSGLPIGPEPRTKLSWPLWSSLRLKGLPSLLLFRMERRSASNERLTEKCTAR